MDQVSALKLAEELLKSPLGFGLGIYLTLAIGDKAVSWYDRLKNKDKAHLRCLDCTDAKEAIDNSRKTGEATERMEGHLSKLVENSIEQTVILKSIKDNGRMRGG